MQTKLSFYLNEAFKFFVIFMLFFIWINFYYPNFLVSVVIAIIFSSIISFGLSKMFYSKQSAINASKEDRKKQKECSTQFILGSLKDNLDFFSLAFEKRNIENKIFEYYLVLYPNTNNEILFIPQHSAEDVKENGIISAYKQAKAINIKKVIISATNFSQGAVNLSQSLPDVSFALMNEEKTFNDLLKPINFYPEKKYEFKKNQVNVKKEFFKLLLDRKNTKHYFYASVLVFFTSLFIPFSTYYVIFSSIMLLLALGSFYSDKIFAPNTNTQNFIKQKPIK